ncbi:hypothetical protein ACPA9J_04865 [Pseudomonas aeruginosa]
MEAADCVGCVTTSREALVARRMAESRASISTWSAPSCRPCARPTPLAVARARVVVDTRAGALEEAGDLLQGDRRRRHRARAISTELCATCWAGRGGAAIQEITLFKSVGYALEDLVAARRVVDNAA